jgi:hypothetical protein
MTLKLKVAELLADYPILREKKSFLQTAIWQDQCFSLGITTIEQFLTAYGEGKLSNAESIRRVACKLMEEYPELKPTEKTQEENEELNQRIKTNKGEL